MQLPPVRLLLLFLLGAVIGPLGDHGHIVTGTTQYLADDTLFVWDSAWWFPLMVGLATAATAELRLQLAPPRAGLLPRDGLAGIAAVMGLYALTALLRPQPLVPATLLVVTLALLAWYALADRAGVICGLAVAFGGCAVEALMAAAGLFRYADDIDVLFGVAPWLPALYFTFGIVAAQLGEIAATTDRPAGRTGQP
jgi:hypothetical protein